MNGGVVAESEHDPLVILLEREDLLGHVHLLGGDLLEQHVVQLGTGEQDAIITNTTEKTE